MSWSEGPKSYSQTAVMYQTAMYSFFDNSYLYNATIEPIDTINMRKRIGSGPSGPYYTIVKKYPKRYIDASFTWGNQSQWGQSGSSV